MAQEAEGTHRSNSAYPQASAIFVGLSMLSPWFEVRPNRIASGHPFFVWQYPLAVWASAALCIAFVASVVIDRVIEGRSEREHSSKAISSAQWLVRLPAYIVWLLALAVFAAVITGVPIAAEKHLASGKHLRVSPDAGFWLVIIGSVLAIRWAKLRLKPAWPPLAAELAVIASVLYFSWKAGAFERFSPYLELIVQGRRFISELMRHLTLSIFSFASALIIGVFVAILLYRGRRIGALLGKAAGVVQNIPSLALFGLLLPIMALLADTFPVLRSIGISGIGFAPAFLALVAYAILPIMLAGVAGLRMVDAGVKDAARGMGMSSLEILLRVELPLALPAIAAGARTALVQTIGTTTIAALIGAGGMGYFVFQGVGQAAMDMVIIGVIPIVALSIMADRVMGALERRLARKRGDAWP